MIILRFFISWELGSPAKLAYSLYRPYMIKAAVGVKHRKRTPTPIVLFPMYLNILEGGVLISIGT